MNISEKEIINKITKILNNNHISEFEKNIFIKYLQKINKKEYINKVIEDLKLELCIPAIKKQLSKEVVEFYTEISRLTPGRRTIGSLFNSFIKKKKTTK